MTPERARLLDTALSEFAVTARVLVIDGMKFYHREPVEKLAQALQALRAHDASHAAGQAQVGETVEIRAGVYQNGPGIYSVMGVRYEDGQICVTPSANLIATITARVPLPVVPVIVAEVEESR